MAKRTPRGEATGGGSEAWETQRRPEGGSRSKYGLPEVLAHRVEHGFYAGGAPQADVSQSGDDVERPLSESGNDDPRLLRYSASEKATDLDAWREFAQLCFETQRDGALRRLAGQSGVGEGTLRAYANVGRWILDDEWNALRQWRDREGRCLTKWHITYLAGRTSVIRSKCLHAMRDRIWGAVKIRDWEPEQNVGRPTKACTASTSTSSAVAQRATCCVVVQSEADMQLAKLAHVNVPGVGMLLTPKQLRWYRCSNSAPQCSAARNRN